MEKKVCAARMARPLFWLCFFAYLVSCLGRYNYLAVMAELIAAEGFTKAGAGMIGTAMFVSYGICQIGAGILGDRVSPRRMFTFGIIGSAVLNACMGFLHTQGAMLVLWAVNGLFQSCLWSPVARIFAEMLPEKFRTKACSDAAATLPIANMLVYLLAAGTIRFLNWRFAFWIPAVLMLAAALIWEWGMHKAETHIAREGIIEQTEGAAGGRASGMAGMIIGSGAVFIAVAALSHGLLKDGIQSWLPTLLSEQFAVATYAGAAVAVIVPLFSLIGVLVTRWLAGKYLKNELQGAGVFFTCALISLALLNLAGTESGFLTVGMLTIASTCMVGANILLINLIPMRFGAVGRTSTMTGFLNCHAYAGSAISSYGVGAAAERFGWSAALIIWLAFALAACAACYIGAARWGGYKKTRLESQNWEETVC